MTYEPICTPPAAPAQPAQSPNPLSLDDDDDEALQAVLLASILASSEAAAGAPSSEAAAIGTERSLKEQDAAFESAVKPPLVAMPSSLSAFGVEAKVADTLQTALAALEQDAQLKLVKVRGDGHCLYRVFGAALILGAAWSGREALDALHAHVTSAALDPSARVVGDLIAAVLARAKATPSAALEALNDESDGAEGADALVAALRLCGVAYMTSAADRFRHCAPTRRWRRRRATARRSLASTASRWPP